ncbi:MAG TPA: J domain-containing protein [Vicinamibacteria bacterium]|nr:J domain-containing protein [Vicinamibacteria bacterium]
MATLHLQSPSGPASSRRREILDLYASLAGSSHAQVLGVPPGASPATVREAFVALARRLHPDTLAPGDADLRDQLQAIFIRLNDAYRSLGSDHPTTRAAKRSPDPPRETTAPKVLPPPNPPVAPPPPPNPAERHARVEEALASAEALIARREIEEAVSVLHDVHSLANDGQRRRMRLILARAYVGDPRWRRYGLGLLNEMLEETPEDADALTQLGVLYHREKQLARAEATLLRALAAEPGQAEARQHLRAVRAAREGDRTPGRKETPGRRALVARLRSIGRQWIRRTPCS